MEEYINGGVSETPIQKYELEQVILGGLMIDKDAYALVCDILAVTSFYDTRHQLIYEAIKAQADEGKPVDILLVTERLVKMGKLELAGGPGYVAELSSRVASSANIEFHANVVAQAALRRNGRNLLAKSYKDFYDETHDIDNDFDQLEEALFKLRDYRSLKEVRPLSGILPGVIHGIQDAAANIDGITGVPSYPKLDEKTAGWQEQDLVIIAGRPSMGKTSFALCAAKLTAFDHNIPTAFFSLEMSAEQLMVKIISNVCEVDSKRLQTGRLTPEEWQKIDHDGVNLMMAAPLYIDDTPGITIGEFRNKAKRLVREYGIKCIFIDYLQLMNGSVKGRQSRQEEVSHISRSLKVIAKELGVPIIALSQLNRSVENRTGLDGKRPQLSDLRESGAIEQDADMVIFVHRPEYYGIYTDEKGQSLVGKAYIIIAKHRKGPIGEILMSFEAEYTRFDDDTKLT